MKPLRHALAATFALIATASLGACAASSYLGIPLTPGAADPALQQLAQRARAGDKQAQLKLGIAFEEGRGVERNSKNASILLRLAKIDTDSQDVRWFYMPSPIPGTPGRVINIEKEPFARQIYQRTRGEISTFNDKPIDSDLNITEKEINVNCGSLGNSRFKSLSSLLFCPQEAGAASGVPMHEPGFFPQVAADIVVERRTCPSPTLVSRGIICRSTYHEIEVILREDKNDICYKYMDMYRYLDKSSIVPVAIINSSAPLPPAQQTSVNVGQSVMIMYPAIENLKTCITRILIVKPV